VGGGGVEELTRVFILTRFRNTWGRTGLIMGILIEAAVFGLGHLYQGWIGAVSGAFSGLLFALVWLRKGRIVEAMTAHACEDVVGLSIGFVMGHL
jgi:membrane protease YdiL (CAAX protease family)